MKLGKIIYGIVFNKLIYVDYNYYTKGGLMATTSTNAELMNRIDKQNEVISHALNRISNLTDEIAGLKNEVKRFKQDVAKDVTYLTERVK